MAIQERVISSEDVESRIQAEFSSIDADSPFYLMQDAFEMKLLLFKKIASVVEGNVLGYMQDGPRGVLLPSDIHERGEWDLVFEPNTSLNLESLDDRGNVQYSLDAFLFPKGRSNRIITSPFNNNPVFVLHNYNIALEAFYRLQKPYQIALESIGNCSVVKIEEKFTF